MKTVEDLIFENKYKEAIDQLRIFIQENITGSDLNSLKIKSDFRMLYSEFITQDIQQKKGADIASVTKKDGLKTNILALLRRLRRCIKCKAVAPN